MPEPTPGPTGDPTPDPTPAQEAQVRRLLAELRPDQPVPADVAHRLDAVLAELSRERGDADRTAADPARPSAPVDLVARRRRRVGRVLVAAAIVVVVGLGLGRVVDGLVRGGGSAGSGSTADTAGSAVEATGAPPVGLRAQRAYAAARAPRVRPATFTADVTRVRRLVGAQALDHVPATRQAVRACAPVAAGAGRRVPVRYAGRPAVLVLRPAAGGNQVADLYPCRGTTVERSVTLPAP